jgi:hypothetical protein
MNPERSLLRYLDNFERVRGTLLEESPWHVGDSNDVDSLFTIPDHGDLIVPEFQLVFSTKSKEFFSKLNNEMSIEHGCDPWTIWIHWAGRIGGNLPTHQILGEDDDQSHKLIRKLMLSAFDG